MKRFSRGGNRSERASRKGALGVQRATCGGMKEQGNRLQDIYRGCPSNSILTAAAGRTEREEDAR